MDSTSAKILYQQRLLETVESTLTQQRASHAQKMVELQSRRVELELKQSKFLERKEKFEKFLRENETKKQKALIKAASERKRVAAKEEELGVVDAQIAKGNIRIAETGARLEKWQKYRIFLDRVSRVYNSHASSATASSSGLDKNQRQLPTGNEAGESGINEIISRYETLRGTNEELQQQMSDYTRQMDQLSHSIQRVRTDAADRIVQLTSEQSNHQVELERALATTSTLLVKMDECSAGGLQEMRSRAGKNLAIDNLYAKTAGQDREGQAIEIPLDTAEKMAQVKSRLTELIQVSTRARKLLKQDRVQKPKVSDRGNGGAISDGENLDNLTLGEMYMQSGGSGNGSAINSTNNGGLSRSQSSVSLSFSSASGADAP